MQGGRHLITSLKREILHRDYYDLRKFSPGSFDTIIDIGANIGMFSLYARFLQPLARIIAIEPHPAIFKILQDNTRRMDIETINFLH